MKCSCWNKDCVFGSNVFSDHLLLVWKWVTHILFLFSLLPLFLLPFPPPLPPPAFPFPLPPDLHSLFSESVETPSSGGGPPIREWVLVGVAGSSQLGSSKRIKKKVANMHREFEQALQENTHTDMMALLYPCCTCTRGVILHHEWLATAAVFN